MQIDVPSISLSELNRMTGNFGDKSLVGEGSYGKVYYATLNTGEPAAIKKFDPSVANDPEIDFSAQVE
jgi:serine/threonine protein kinase